MWITRLSTFIVGLSLLFSAFRKLQHSPDWNSSCLYHHHIDAIMQTCTPSAAVDLVLQLLRWFLCRTYDSVCIVSSRWWLSVWVNNILWLLGRSRKKPISLCAVHRQRSARKKIKLNTTAEWFTQNNNRNGRIHYSRYSYCSAFEPVLFWFCEIATHCMVTHLTCSACKTVSSNAKRVRNCNRCPASRVYLKYRA